MLVYICPIALGANEINYIHRFLAGIGIRSVTNRLHIVVPELIPKLPSHMTIAQCLWYSAGALRKIRRLVASHSHPSSSCIVPAAVTWIEKRIAWCDYE